MTKDDDLLAKAQAGTITGGEIAEVARALSTNIRGRDQYTLLFILGRSGALQYEYLVAKYLEHRSDPMLVRVALEVLCDDWNKAASYRDKVEQFIRGVSWDSGGHVRLLAISIAGEMMRVGTDKRFLRLLMDIFDDPEERYLIKEAAYSAMARAIGKEWKEILHGDRIDSRLRVDEAIVTQARTLLSGFGPTP